MLANQLRKIAERGQHGHSRTPSNYYMTGEYCSYYWSHCTDLVTFEEWEKIAKLSERYHRMLDWIRENEWEQGEVTYWADNSVSATFTHKRTGETEERMLKPPSGDIC